jgi:beta-lactamase regulating signal transducer with metallopeptidase domain
MHFFESYIGMYMVQSVVHSMVTLLIIEASLRVWQVSAAGERFRYRLLVILLPFFMFPVFQIIDPRRGSFYFVQDSALFSSMRWLDMDLFGTVPLSYAFLFIAFAVSAVVIIQEIVPIIRDLLARRGETVQEGLCPCSELQRIVAEMSDELRIKRPAVMIIESESPLIYTSGTTSHTIIVSCSLLEAFDMRQLRTALAHELAHIVRRSTIITLFVFFVRLCMFYNPVSLLQFRRLVQDDEQICDDITVSITGDAQALASALTIFTFDLPRHGALRLAELRDALESSSHNLLLSERISRLESADPAKQLPAGWGRYVLTLLGIVLVNYFVV